jgi:hypothetical protein
MTERFTIVIDCSIPLSESWDKFALDLGARGATAGQLDAMRAAFFFGAVHVYSRFDATVRDCDSFCDAMDELLEEISTARASDLPVAGNA